MTTTSIVLATHNGDRFLREQLQSYAEQYTPPDELVVSDDASHDDTLVILERFRLESPFYVRIYRNEQPLGYAQNFSQVMTRCTGDLIFLSDQDDIWLPSKVERVARIHERRRQLLYVHDLGYLSADGKVSRKESVLTEMRRRKHPTSRLVKGCATVVTRELAAIALPVPAGMAHDNWLHDLAEALDGREVVKEVLAEYRVHGGQESGHRPLPFLPVSKILAGKVERSSALLAPRVRTLEEMKRRFQELSAPGKEPSRWIDPAAVCRLDEELRNLRLRDELVRTKGILRRLGLAMSYAIRGVYEGPGRLRSMVRDVVFP